MIDGGVAARADLERIVFVVVDGVFVRGIRVADRQQFARLRGHLRRENRMELEFRIE